jgi:LysM repeat protein
MSMYNRPGQPGQYGQPYQGQPGQYGQPYQGQPDQYYGQPYQGQPDRYRCRPYTVQRGDTLGSLARRYGISVDVLAAANPNVNLQQGQDICIPISGRR